MKGENVISSDKIITNRTRTKYLTDYLINSSVHFIVMKSNGAIV